MRSYVLTRQVQLCDRYVSMVRRFSLGSYEYVQTILSFRIRGKSSQTSRHAISFWSWIPPLRISNVREARYAMGIGLAWLLGTRHGTDSNDPVLVWT